MPLLQSSMSYAEFLTAYEAKLTAGYSETYTTGQNAGVTVSTQQGQHATVTAGKLLNLVENRKTTLSGIITGASRPRGSPRLLSQDNSSINLVDTGACSCVLQYLWQACRQASALIQCHASACYIYFDIYLLTRAT